MRRNFTRSLIKAIFALVVFITGAPLLYAQTMMPLPAQNTTYSGYVRGFWFIAPMDFTITGLRVPASAGPGDQSIQVMKIGSGGVAVYPTMGTNFTTLYYTNSGANNVIQSVNIAVSTGDTIGILGQAGTSTSYSVTTPFSSSIGGMSVDLHRFLYQGPINASQAPEYSSEASSTIGRIEVYYIIAPPDNAGIDSLVNPTLDGEFCSGVQDIKVRLRNLGSNTLQNVQINWSIDGVLQTPVAYSTAIDSLSSPDNWAIVTLGTADFPFNTPVEIKSWTSMPNGVPDTDNSDDTLTQTVTSLKQGIMLSIHPQDTTICTGSSVTLDAGAHPSSPIYVWNTGALTRTINVTTGGDYYVKVMNATGCEASDTVRVTVNPSPSASSVSEIDLGAGNFSFGVVAPEHVDIYQWNFGDGSATQTGGDSMTHHYTANGVYGVTVFLINDCGQVVKSRQVNVESVTGIPELNVLKAAISMYPNPAHDQVTLQAKDGLKIHKIAFYDLLGRKVYAASVNGDKALISIAVLPDGFYQVVVDTDKGRVSKKLTVSNEM
jgi:hypothetical protein